jgi:hypothetical protein
MSLTKVSYSMIQGALINVLDYGAVGDNTVDCTTAFQAAIDDCPDGGTVFIPVGKFKLTSAITTSKAVQLTGAGFTNASQAPFGDAAWADTTKFGGTVLISTQTSGAIFSIGDPAVNQCFQVSNLMLVGPGTGTSTGFQFLRSVGSCIDNVLVCNTYKGFNANNVQDTSYNKLAAKGCQIGITLGGTITSNQTVFVNPEFQSYGDYGIENLAAAVVALFGGIFQDGRGVGIGYYNSANSSFCTLNSVWFESFSPTCFGVYDLGTGLTLQNCYFATPGDRIFIGATSSYAKLINNFFDPTMTDAIYIAAGAQYTKLIESDPTGTGTITDLGTYTIQETSRGLDGVLFQKLGSRAAEGTDTIGGVPRNAGTNTVIAKKVTGLTDAAFTTCLNVFIPNAATAATIRIKALGSIGAGGAIGANEASASLECDVIIARTAGLTAVVAQSASYGTATAAVAGATTCAVAIDSSLVAGAANADQTLIIRVSVTKGGGASTGHSATLFAELLNMNDSGALIFA